MSTGKLSLDGLLIFEQPFARVPYENYRKVFRTAQKNIERELGAIQTTANDLAINPQISSQDPQEAINSLISRVEGLKRKVTLPFPPLFSPSLISPSAISCPICKRLPVHLPWKLCASDANILPPSRISRAPKIPNTHDGLTSV
jgi:hypothetical protein